MIIFEERIGPGEVFVCATCKTHLALVSDLESRQFKGKTGPAILMTNVVNYRCGPPEDRSLLTGQHTIMEIYCQACEVNIGWTYVRAYEQSQEYKEGKFILEEAYIKKVHERGLPPVIKKRGEKSTNN